MISAVDEDLARARAVDISSATAGGRSSHALNDQNFIADSDSDRSSFSNSSIDEEDNRRMMALPAAGRMISLHRLDRSRNDGNSSETDLSNSQRFSTRPSDSSFEALNQWLPQNIAANAEKRGIIYKQCPKFSFLWQKRFFILTNEGIIYYYAKENDAEVGRSPKGIIMLDDLQKIEGAKNGMYDAVCVFQNRLNIHVYSKNHRVYRLKLKDIEEAAAWQEAIYSHLPRIYGSPTKNRKSSIKK